MSSIKPYPRHCAFCKKHSVVKRRISYHGTFLLNGKLEKFHIPELEIDECENCKEQFFTSKTDEMIQALHRKLGLKDV